MKLATASPLQVGGYIKDRFGAGDIAAALYDASEAVRLLRGLQASTSSSSSLPYVDYLSGTEEAPAGCWQVQSLTLVSLSQIGRLQDIVGSGGGAHEAFCEAQQLVDSSTSVLQASGSKRLVSVSASRAWEKSYFLRAVAY